jgi:hypothetical protein
VGIVSRGFTGRKRSSQPGLPPGQYLVDDFPVLSAGPTPRIDRGSWEFRIVTEDGSKHAWDWTALRALPSQDVTVDLHCVTKWSKLGTRWAGVPLDALLGEVDTAAEFALVGSYDGYTTNLPLADLRNGQAWIAYSYDGADLDPSTAARPGCSSRTCTCGNQPNGSAAFSCSTRTSRASGKAPATTTTETHGASSGTGATDLADRHGYRAARRDSDRPHHRP